MKRTFFIAIITLLSTTVNAQSFDEDRIILSQFVERIYNNAPFEGCRIIDDYDNSYLLSVVVLDASKYKVPTALNRAAQVKSQRNAGEFFNGTQSFSEFTIKTPKCKEQGDSKPIIVETVEVIKTHSSGFVQQMQLLSTFEDANKMKVFVFYKQLSDSKSKM